MQTYSTLCKQLQTSKTELGLYDTNCKEKRSCLRLEGLCVSVCVFDYCTEYDMLVVFRERTWLVWTLQNCVFVYLETLWRENWTRQIKVLLFPHLRLHLRLPFFQSQTKSQSTYRSEIHIAWHFASLVGLCASTHQCPTERADVKVYIQEILFHTFSCMLINYVNLCIVFCFILLFYPCLSLAFLNYKNPS